MDNTKLGMRRLRMKDTNKRARGYLIKTLTEVSSNPKSVNVCEYTVKMVLQDNVFTYIHSSV
jgi:hypothetical protein